MKELTDKQLKNASIVDLTDDLELMRKVLGMRNFEVSDVKKFTKRFTKLLINTHYYGIH